ncbi:excinuclease ABC subunit A [Candidatus Woesebacteria bacterium RIFOXYB1_FULL_38_16]|uniref:UvrABC system protein A n=1 Tax=Candidatus Woesebacteria bacterium RIFOXYB1_FULL_38_16 TaxID=1802538 RepID=A0A1F8CR73_9BACT|nr:MAG: excinuclease ABC subunit A [Candidatus Woesebacteria bacterium RIFOXYA1_FULL_38_9]OGM78837.1 MAG: excinuclease ABC subunit A [Candidatus Woesebacteria bacterium RIFOXYB1_FULL_38_16]
MIKNKSSEYIQVRGARQHNLQNVDIDIPKNCLVCFSGVSGSGKSSLAFDTIYAEGQRRYVESLSTYARQFLGIMSKPDVDSITGLSPAISIDQKTVSRNPRSTVGTVTEIYDYLRLLFARVGHPHCPKCGREIAGQSLDQITNQVMELIKDKAGSQKPARFLLLSPVVADKKGTFNTLFENLRAKGYKRVRIDGHFRSLDEDFVLIKTNKHTIDVVTDRIAVTRKDFSDQISLKNLHSRLSDSIEQALKLADGLTIVCEIQDTGFDIPENPKKFRDFLFSERFACPVDNISLPEIEPRTFSFNSPHGACEVCHGLGRLLRINPESIIAPLLSIKEGGIIPYASIFEHDTWFSRLILDVCEKNNIDPNARIKSFSEKQMQLIMYGTGETKYRIEGINSKGNTYHWQTKFRGVVNELERRYRETQSDYVRSAIEKHMVETLCESCLGARLKKEALAVTIDGKSISEISEMTIIRMLDLISKLSSETLLSEREREIGKLILKEIEIRLTFLRDVGLEYLNLARSAATLSGGEAQRIRLASQIGSGLTGVLYVLDEPTIGLHPRDNDKLVSTLKRLRDLGNSVVVVEHDRDVMNEADYVFDFGPGAGKYGGKMVAEGTPLEIKNNKDSLTGQFLSGRRKISILGKTQGTSRDNLLLKGARQFNLKNLDVKIPLGKFVTVTGVSGSGKSTLVVETLYHALAKEVNKFHQDKGGDYDRLEGAEKVDKVVLIDQSPIGRTPRSNPATYTKVFDDIRDIYTNVREAKALGFKKGRFSFNVKGGRCETCEGQGKIKIEMQFMPDIWIDCEVCKGDRYNSQTLEVDYNGINIAQCLKMTVDEALEHFHVYSKVVQKLETLKAVGLEYIQLGQSATTLSGGEAQRVKLAAELGKRATGSTVYILDEPTTGLHFHDLEKLLMVLKILVSRGNSVVVVEHNLDVIRNSDWIIDLGPEGGDKGGNIVAEGTPEEIAKVTTSYTGAYLRRKE